jgi:hypothetical protein
MFKERIAYRVAACALNAASLTAIISVMPATADAQSVLVKGVAVGVTAPATQATAAQVFWTPERLLSAKPMEVSPSNRFNQAPLAAGPAPLSSPTGEPGSPPTVTVAPEEDNMVHPPISPDSLEVPQVTPELNLGAGLFTESRIFPPSNGQSAPAVYGYPHRAAGKLYFHDPRTGGFGYCSASTDSPRIILTAGHCVAHGSTIASQRYFYDQFLYIPAYNNGAAPYGTWGWAFAATTTDWFNNGAVPNAHDFGMIEAVDHGASMIGPIVGWLGWETGQLSSNHFSSLGYPSNLDSGLLMQRNDAQTSAFGGKNTWTQGTSFGPGSSGGPWVQDLGVQPAGGPPEPFGGNIVVGVTSYGPLGSIGFIGASQFDGTFVNLRTFVCGHRAGNC